MHHHVIPQYGARMFRVAIDKHPQDPQSSKLGSASAYGAPFRSTHCQLRSDEAQYPTLVPPTKKRKLKEVAHCSAGTIYHTRTDSTINTQNDFTDSCARTRKTRFTVFPARPYVSCPKRRSNGPRAEPQISAAAPLTTYVGCAPALAPAYHTDGC